MTFTSKTFATAFTVLALGAVVANSAFAQQAGGGGRGGAGGGSGGDGPTTMTGAAVASVPNNTRYPDTFNMSRGVPGPGCETPTEGRHGPRGQRSACGAN